jgi:hypothetical protein
MSKKKKFKKFSKAQFLEEINKSENLNQTEALINTKKESHIVDTRIINQENTNSANNQNYKYVKSDLARIALVLLFIFIILAAIVVIDKKTPWLSSFTDKLVNTLNLNQ